MDEQWDHDSEEQRAPVAEWQARLVLLRALVDEAEARAAAMEALADEAEEAASHRWIGG